MQPELPFPLYQKRVKFDFPANFEQLVSKVYSNYSSHLIDLGYVELCRLDIWISCLYLTLIIFHRHAIFKIYTIFLVRWLVQILMLC